MVANLIIGKVGLELDLAHPFQIDESVGGSDRTISIRGHVKDTTNLDEAKNLRHQMQSQVRGPFFDGLVALESLADPSIDGFYILESSSLSLSHDLGSLEGFGFFPYTARLRHVNTNVFSAGITGGVLPNDHSVVTGDPFVAPPFGAQSFTPEPTNTVARVGADGTVVVFRGVDETATPQWSLDPDSPTDLYRGGGKIRIAQVPSSARRLISGLYVADQFDPADYELENTLVRVQAGATAGQIEIATWDTGMWASNTAFEITEAGAAIGAWDSMLVLRNDPEEVAVRLIQNRSATNTGRRTLDISIRRGSRFAHCFYTTTTSATLVVRRGVSDAASVFAPWGVFDFADDGDGNRWALGTLSAHTTVVAGQSGITKTGASTTFDFFVGHEFAGSAAQVGDDVDDLGNQYIHHLVERTQPMVAGGVV